MKDQADENLFESVEQALGALEWVLVQIVFNVRARTATALRQYLDHAGIKIPESVIQSRKWFGAFHRAPSIANHKDGFGGLLRDRLFELGFEENAVWDAIEGLEQDLPGVVSGCAKRRRQRAMRRSRGNWIACASFNSAF